MAAAAAAAAAALSRIILPLLSSQRRHRGFAISQNSWKYECDKLVMSSSIVVLKGCYRKNYSSCSVSCLSTTVVNPERSIMLEELSIEIDGGHKSQGDHSELFRQLEDLSTEIKTKLKNQEIDDVVQLLDANYELVKVEMENGLEGIEQAAVLEVFALGYFSAGDINTAWQILNTMDSIVSGIHEGSSMLGTVLYHMGALFYAFGKFDDAMRVHERCLKTLEKEFGNFSVFLTEPLLGLAKALEKVQRPREAIPLYKRAIDILEKEEGIRSVKVCVPLHSLGDLLLRLGEVEDALEYFQRVLEIHREVYGENDGETGLAICSVAQALSAKGDMYQAISMFKQGLQVIKEANDIPLHDDYLDSARLELAELLHTTGRLREAREVLQESLLINQKHWGINHPSTVAQLMNLATSYSRSKNYVEAERLLRVSLNIMSKSMGPEHQATTVPMLHLAVILFHQKQFEEAESLALEALRIREVIFGPNSDLAGEALDCLLAIQAVHKRDKGEVLEKQEKVLPIQEILFGSDSEEDDDHSS